MKQRRLILIGTLASVAAGIRLYWPRGPKEPVYQGKQLSRWMREAYEDAINSGRILAALGAWQAPALMAFFDKSPARGLRNARQWRGCRPWRRRRLEESPRGRADKRWAAMEARQLSSSRPALSVGMMMLILGRVSAC